MNALNRSARLFLAVALLGLGSGATVALTTQPLAATVVPSVGYGHSDQVNGTSWCHCDDNSTACYPCSTEPPPPQQ